MKLFITFFILISLNSCVPIKIAPQIADYKVTKGKGFQKQLPKQQTFVFNDPKKSNEFYQFLDAKIGFDNLKMDYYLPITINTKKYFLSYYEVSRDTKTLNFVPILFDAAAQNKGIDPILEDSYVTKIRKGDWYIAITVHNDKSSDCLNTNFVNQKEVVQYLKNLKDEYLVTSNYTEIRMKKK